MGKRNRAMTVPELARPSRACMRVRDTLRSVLDHAWEHAREPARHGCEHYIIHGTHASAPWAVSPARACGSLSYAHVLYSGLSLPCMSLQSLFFKDSKVHYWRDDFLSRAIGT